MCEAILYCALICIFLVINDVEHFFMYLLAICMYFFRKISMQVIWLFFELDFICFAIDLYKFFVYFG